MSRGDILNNRTATHFLLTCDIASITKRTIMGENSREIDRSWVHTSHT